MKSFAVPACAARQGTTVISGRMFSTKIPFNAPVVRQKKRSPMLIVKIRSRGTIGIAQKKFPALVKIKRQSWSRRSLLLRGSLYVKAG